MRHRKAGRKFGRDWQERKALFRRQGNSHMFIKDITTTEAKAKSLRPIVEKLITIAREGFRVPREGGFNHAAP